MRVPANLITAPGLPSAVPLLPFLGCCHVGGSCTGRGGHPAPSFNQDRGSAGKESFGYLGGTGSPAPEPCEGSADSPR